jgi:hypothetical protein
MVSLLDLSTKKILDAHVLKKNEEGVTSSLSMEPIGVRRLLESFLHPHTSIDIDDNQPATSSSSTDTAVRISHLVTDDSSTLIKMMKTDYRGIFHSGDPWHLAKCIRKRLSKAASYAACRELGFWIKSIDNFLWTCMINCEGDDDRLVEQWR